LRMASNGRCDGSTGGRDRKPDLVLLQVDMRRLVKLRRPSLRLTDFLPRLSTEADGVPAKLCEGETGAGAETSFVPSS
jgi:hypothetical protein